MMCLSMGRVAFAVHIAQKVEVIVELEQGISVDGCSCSLLVGTLVSFNGAWVIFIVLVKGLPIPGIDFFEAFPLLTLVVANLELVNSFCVPLGRLRILLLITSSLDPMLCLILILLVEGY